VAKYTPPIASPLEKTSFWGISLYRFVRSMKFGMLLLGLIGAACMYGIVEPDIYSSVPFIIIASALCINLFLCSIGRIGKIVKMMGSYRPGASPMPTRIKLRLCAGYLGSWLIHTGILLIIIFYAYGSMHQYTEILAGAPGDIIALRDLGFQIEIGGIKAEYRNNGTINQYIAELKISTDDGKIIKRADIKANHPLRHNGYSFYQDRTVFPESMPYTFIRIIKIPGSSGVLTGSIMLAAGLIVSFCVKPGYFGDAKVSGESEDLFNNKGYDKSMKGNEYVN
jgi:hypothetical protein